MRHDARSISVSTAARRFIGIITGFALMLGTGDSETVSWSQSVRAVFAYAMA